MDLQPNKYGRFKKVDVMNAGYEVITYGLTATEIEEHTGIKLTLEQKLKHCLGFKCSRFGCVPTFDILQVAIDDGYGRL
jgi:hypothetical protein